MVVPNGVVDCPHCGGPLMVENETDVWTLCNCWLSAAEFADVLAEATRQSIQRAERLG